MHMPIVAVIIMVCGDQSQYSKLVTSLKWGSSFLSGWELPMSVQTMMGSKHQNQSLDQSPQSLNGPSVLEFM